MTDLRLALRALARARVFVVLAVLTLGLGIGLNAGLFAVVDGILFKPLPFHDAEQVFRLMSVTTSGSYTAMAGKVIDLVAANPDVVGVTSVSRLTTVASVADPDAVFTIVPVAYGGLGVLRPRLARGRLPRSPDGAEVREALVRYETWTTRFGAEPTVLGRTFELDGMSLVVVGVLERGMVWPSAGPLTRFDFAIEQPRASAPAAFVLAPVGRIKPGARFETVQAALAVHNAVLFAEGPSGAEAGRHIRVAPLQWDLFTPHRPAVLALFGGSVLLLLLSATNVAGLLLARGMARQRVYAIQRSLGASTLNMVRQSLSESALVAGAGAVLGVGLCYLVFRSAVAYIPPILTGVVPTEFGLRGFWFGLIVAAAVVPLLTLAAVREALRRDVWTGLARGVTSGPATGSASGRGSVVLAAEAAIAIVLITAASLVVTSFVRAVTVELGYEPEGLTRAGVLWNSRPPVAPEILYARGNDVLRALESHPDVSGVATIDASPLGPMAPFRGMSATRGERRGVFEVSANYADVMRFSIVDGRWFSEQEQRANAPVAVINATAARTLGHDGARLGGYFKAPGDMPRLIVGIVHDMRPRRLEDAPGAMFVPAIGASRGSMEWMVRTRLSPGTLAETIASIARRHDARARGSAEQVSAMLGSQTALLQFEAALFGAFGWIALILAGVGVYAVQRYLVERRRFEIGVRLALGADARSIRLLVLRSALKPVVIGGAIGMVLAAVLVRGLRALVFGVEVYDPLVFAIAAAVLGCAASAGALGPARSAARVDPLVVLKAE